MNKTIKIVFFTLLGIYIIFWGLNQTGLLQTFTIASISSEPNLKQGARAIASNFVTPQNGDFVTLKRNDTLKVVHRLCAQENDTVEIKNGILYVNRKNVDASVDLMHRYKIPAKEFQSKYVYSKIPVDVLFPIEENDTVTAYLTDKLVKELKLNAFKIIQVKGSSDALIAKTYHQNWNKDFFGPIIVPKGKSFVLGDNRDNVEDSRHFGFIDNSKIVGTLIYN